MFDVVTGIPKSEGMQRPPKIPANPSFVELDEDENAVEKFKTAVASISNILALDRLKQVSCYHVQVVPLYTLAYPCISLHIFAYLCISLHIFVYLWISLHTFAYPCVSLHIYIPCIHVLWYHYNTFVGLCIHLLGFAYFCLLLYNSGYMYSVHIHVPLPIPV